MGGPNVRGAMSEPWEMFSSVLIGVDGQSGGRDAIALANQLADPSGRVLAAHVHPGGERVPRSPYDAEFVAGQDDESIKLLEQACAATKLEAMLTTIASPSVGGGLHRLAEIHAVGLLVVGSTSHSPIGRVLLGDHARAALNSAPCAVAIAPAGYAKNARPLRTLGAAHNGTIESEAALAAARELAVREGSKIRALSVMELPSLEPTPVATNAALRATLEAEQKRLDALDGVDGEAVYGPVGATLAEFGERVDLLVVGSRSYGPAGTAHQRQHLQLPRAPDALPAVGAPADRRPQRRGRARPPRRAHFGTSRKRSGGIDRRERARSEAPSRHDRRRRRSRPSRCPRIPTCCCSDRDARAGASATTT
jgi:nucleotide-binding universal stress UspA family protein